tara:strand:- start:48 stop:392 length:345 start_codon:yes stop_codon:yes gene_type:complete
MSNVISINRSNGRDDIDKKESRDLIYNTAAEIERRCIKIKEHASAGNKDAFLWSNIAMLHQSLEVMNKQIDILIDDIKYDEGLMSVEDLDLDEADINFDDDDEFFFDTDDIEED